MTIPTNHLNASEFITGSACDSSTRHYHRLSASQLENRACVCPSRLVKIICFFFSGKAS